ncbi:hypothetical protein KI387_016263, partial [Taxus chinensis]
MVDVFPSRRIMEDHGSIYVGAAHTVVEEEALINEELHYVDIDKESESFFAHDLLVMPKKIKKGGEGKQNEMVELLLLSSKACVEEDDVAAERCLLEDMKIEKDVQVNARDADLKEELGMIECIEEEENAEKKNSFELALES